MRWIVILFGAGLVLVGGLAEAKIYRCNEGGKLVFSDKPCSATGQEVQPGPGTGNFVQTDYGNSTASAADQEFFEKTAQDSQRIILDNDITRKEKQIRALHGELNERLEELRLKKLSAANNLAGAAWEASISQEMSAITQEYNLRIQTRERELRELQKQRAKYN